ncbi:MAG: hypothetical protein ABSG53_09005 [Thermoguttaceae bacterium]|jgi:hypothetical protein
MSLIFEQNYAGHFTAGQPGPGSPPAVDILSPIVGSRGTIGRRLNHCHDARPDGRRQGRPAFKNHR